VLCVLFEFAGCKEQVGSKSKSLNAVADNTMVKLKIAKSNNMQFQYPGNWYMNSSTSKGTTWFRLTDESDTTTVFFPIEIWEFPLSIGSFERFSNNVTYEFFVHQTDGKNGSLLSVGSSKFKNFQAKTFEYTKSGFPVEIITVNGINKYYMLVSFGNKLWDKIAKNMFNSIVISRD